MTSLFALRHKKTKKFMTFSVTSNGDADFCGDITTELEIGYQGDKIWVTDNRSAAEQAANNNTNWFNSSHDWPVNKFVGQLEVVEFREVE